MGFKALIVDDVEANCRVLKACLEPFDGHADAVHEARAAIDSFHNAWKLDAPYQVIFLDVKMPQIGGIKLLQILRTMEEKMNVPQERRARIIMVTCDSDSQTQLESWEHGCDGYFVKPINRIKLSECLKKFGIIT